VLRLPEPDIDTPLGTRLIAAQFPGGLACPVGSQAADDLTLGDFQVQAGQGISRAVALGQALGVAAFRRSAGAARR
jgi:hypothetical protein